MLTQAHTHTPMQVIELKNERRLLHQKQSVNLCHHSNIWHMNLFEIAHRKLMKECSCKCSHIRSPHQSQRTADTHTHTHSHPAHADILTVACVLPSLHKHTHTRTHAHTRTHTRTHTHTHTHTLVHAPLNTGLQTLRQAAWGWHSGMARA